MTPKQRRILIIALLLDIPILALVGFLFLWPSPISPVAWSPPQPPPLAGPTAPNEALESAERLAEGLVEGPEDIAIDADGWIWAGLADGRVVRFREDAVDSVDTLSSASTQEPSDTFETVIDTGGRPLGLHFDARGRLLVADAVRGLLRLSRDEGAWRLETLSTETDGIPFRFTDDLDVANDGKIYFSDASHRWGHEHYLYDLLEARPHGRLVVFDPSTGETRTLLDDLYFANGVALSQNEDFVVVNETYRYRLTRYWLEGPKAGTSDVFLDNLPCIPDGTSSDRRGTFWVACFTVRNERADELHPKPFLKKNLAKLPKRFWPQPEPYGIVLAVGEDGTIRRSFQDPGGDVIPQVTSVERQGDVLYLGNLDQGFVGRYELPDALSDEMSDEMPGEMSGEMSDEPAD